MKRVWILGYAFIAFAVAIGAVDSIPPDVTVVISTVALLLVYLVHGYASIGGKSLLKYAAIAYAISFLAEVVGVHSELFGGAYSYGTALGPMVLGVPLLIPLIWGALGYFCMAAAPGNPFLSAGMMAGLDLGFDPVFSAQLGLWTWQTPGPYFGVPVANFIGWFAVSFAFFAVYDGPSPQKSMNGPAFYILFGMTNVLSAISFHEYQLAATAAGILAILTALAVMWTRMRTAPAMSAKLALKPV